MIKRFFGKSGVLLIMVLLVFACSLAQPERQDRRLVGGPCQYKSYPGRATILSITESKAAESDTIKRFDVKFSFAPQGQIEESFARTEGKTFSLYGNNFQYPDQKFITSRNIHIGSILDGKLQVITSGTCTPVLFDFPSLKQ